MNNRRYERVIHLKKYSCTTVKMLYDFVYPSKNGLIFSRHGFSFAHCPSTFDRVTDGGKICRWANLCVLSSSGTMPPYKNIQDHTPSFTVGEICVDLLASQSVLIEKHFQLSRVEGAVKSKL